MSRCLRRRNWICYLAGCYLILGLLVFPDSGYAFVVNGTIQLPSQANGNVEIDVFLEETEGYSYSAQKFTVLSGNSSVGYSLDSNLPGPLRVRYVCLTNCGDMFPYGWVTSTGDTSYRYEDARIFTFDISYYGVNINIPLGYRVEGVVQLPTSDTAATDIGVEVTAWHTDYYSLQQTDSVIIPAGGTSASYSILLPPDPVARYKLNYNIPTRTPTTYYHTGYYHNPVSTSYDVMSAPELIGSTAYPGADLTLLVGRTIEGTISLPAGRTAPAGGLELTVSSINYKYSTGDDDVTVIIPGGGSSGNYTLIMPWDEYNHWQVRYYCSGYFYSTCINEGFLSRGYYAGPSVPTFYTERDNNNNFFGTLWGGENHTGIDLNLIPTKQIGGKLNLPEPAPAGGISLTVYADDPVHPGAMSDSIFIDAGAKSASYLVAIPEDSSLNWRVIHRFNDRIGYVQEAYFATLGTTHLVEEATMLNGGTDHYHIDMNAIPDKDNDGIPDSIDPIRNILNPGVFSLLLKSP